MKSSFMTDQSSSLLTLDSSLFCDLPINQSPADKITCHCYGITEASLKKVACENALTSVSELTEHTGAGSACRACNCRLKCILDQLPKPAKSESEGELSRVNDCQQSIVSAIGMQAMI